MYRVTSFIFFWLSDLLFLDIVLSSIIIINFH